MGLLLRSSPLSGSTEGEGVGVTVREEEVDLSVVIHNLQHITHDVIVNGKLLNIDRNLSMTLISKAFASTTCSKGLTCQSSRASFAKFYS